MWWSWRWGTRLLLDWAGAARLNYHEGFYLAEVDRNMTNEALLRLRLAQLDGEDERLTEGIELGKRKCFLNPTLRDAPTEAATLSLLADLYRKMVRSAEAEDSNSARCRLIAAISSSFMAAVNHKIGLPSTLVTL